MVILFLVATKYFLILVPAQGESCFTAKIRKYELQLICTVDTFDLPVTIRHPSGRAIATYDNSATPSCRFTGQHGEIYQDYNIGTVVIEIPNESTVLDGKWTCEHGATTKATYVSYLNGSIESTNVEIHGEIVTTKENKRISISCSTCQVPDGNLVEFLVNEAVIDFVGSVSEMVCYHETGVCKPTDCTCSDRGNNFTRYFNYPANYSENTTFTCTMHFFDESQQTDFTVHSSLQLVNGGLKRLKTKKITRSGKEISTLYSPSSSETSSTSTILHTDHNTTNVNWWFIVVGALSPLVIFITLCCILLYTRHRQNKNQSKETEFNYKKGPENTGDSTVAVRLIQNNIENEDYSVNNI